jgi:hypothetical protein
MTYREQLNKVRDLGISICDLEIANELDAVLDFEYTEEEFESLCAFGVEIYLKAEKMTTDAIAYCINDLVEEEGKTVEEILKMNKWDFIVKANNWL